ncbi:hypothetical protein [Thomasclavelia cocleata]|uniref:hypothetical protein n=1 Tax=Thomasclavelia cocleata TaxID=69824 RepID=UPI00242EC8AB|nr:hypothetical protein [Thomasclavelia cocleata]
MILDYPKVYEKNKCVGHGGNQEWFLDSWAKKAGCASVSATDIFIYYTKKEYKINKDVYLNHMIEMYKLMKPQERGFPYVYLYARRLSKLLNNCKYIIFRRPSVEVASNIIKESINNNEPLGLLILTHRRHEMHDDLWHWVTIVGYEEGKKGIDIIFLDCGEIKRISAGIVFENSCFNVVKMVRFFTSKTWNLIDEKKT